jgi:hypothetical protein
LGSFFSFLIGVNMKITQQARDLAEKTSDAYSSDRFASWESVIQALLNLGYSEIETEAIVRSKWTRWACDHDTGRNRYGRHTSSAMMRFMKDTPQSEVTKLVYETFGELA